MLKNKSEVLANYHKSSLVLKSIIQFPRKKANKTCKSVFVSKIICYLVTLEHSVGPSHQWLTEFIIITCHSFNIMTIILFRSHWRLVLCVYSGCTVGSTHINKRVLLCPDVDCYDANFGFGLKWVFASNCLFAALTMHSCGEMEYIQRLLNNEKKKTPLKAYRATKWYQVF